MKAQLSLIIPTHKRPQILRECIAHIEKQTIADQLEVIVVSDGPDEATRDAMQNSKFKIHVSYFEIPKSQQGAARNRGVKEASAPTILFLNDDIFLAPDACEAHVKAHKLIHGIGAVLGYIAWDPAVGMTPAMKWLDKTGWQFGYRLLKDRAKKVIPKDVQHRFTYATNFSIPTSFAQKIPFREDVSLYGWEDILWGVDLRNAGVLLFYDPDAKALHHHHITVEDSLKRMETLGASLVHITQIAPELERMPKGIKKLAYHLIALTPTMRGNHYRAFLRGMKPKIDVC